MATITRAWDNDTPPGGQSVGEGDNRIREMKADIQEREQNMGRYWPDGLASPAATAGVLYVSPNAYVPNHYIVYDKDGSGNPDTADRLLDLDITASPYVYVIGNSATTVNQTLYGSLDVRDVLKAKKSKTFTIDTPGSSENLTVGFFVDAMAISKTIVVLRGSSSPSVTGNLVHGTDRSAAGTKLWTSDQTFSSTTTGDVSTTFDNASVAANSFVWFTTSATAGTVTEISFTFVYKET